MVQGGEGRVLEERGRTGRRGRFQRALDRHPTKRRSSQKNSLPNTYERHNTSRTALRASGWRRTPCIHELVTRPNGKRALSGSRLRSLSLSLCTRMIVTTSARRFSVSCPDLHPLFLDIKPVTLLFPCLTPQTKANVIDTGPARSPSLTSSTCERPTLAPGWRSYVARSNPKYRAFSIHVGALLSSIRLELFSEQAATGMRCLPTVKSASRELRGSPRRCRMRCYGGLHVISRPGAAVSREQKNHRITLGATATKVPMHPPLYSSSSAC